MIAAEASLQRQILPFDKQTGLVQLRQQMADDRVIESAESMIKRARDFFEGMRAVE